MFANEKSDESKRTFIISNFFVKLNKRNDYSSINRFIVFPVVASCLYALNIVKKVNIRDNQLK